MNQKSTLTESFLKLVVAGDFGTIKIRRGNIDRKMQ